jgi:hypothetical protein
MAFRLAVEGAASIGKHAQLIEKLGGSSTLKGASAK